MKVFELAKEYKTTSAYILQTLKSLKLKAKDKDQELNAVVLSVLKNHLNTQKNMPPPDEKEEKKAKAVKEKKPRSGTKKESEEKKEKAAETKTKKKTSVKKKVAKTSKEAEEKETKEKKADSEKKETKKPAPKKKTAASSGDKDVKKDEAPKAKSSTGQAEKKTKPKTRLSKEPLITLKPLSKKRKRTTTPSGRGPSKDGSSGPVPGESQGATPSEMFTPERAGQPDAGRDLVDLEIKVPITVKDFSIKIQKKPSFVLKELMKMGIMTHINQALDGELVDKIAHQFGYNYLKIKTQEEQVVETHQQDEDPGLLQSRAPVITFMGHVDHGKTTLLDKIRKSKVVDSEHGGITQHIGAYSVNLPKGKITFLDTPGHEAFTAMRARGAHITDLVVVVVAADEGIMPQTEEAIDHARAANVPIVVALNKIDRQNADQDRVKKELAEKGLAAEDWGGKTVVVGVSAITGEGVDTLLEMILLEAELLELKANPDKQASGIVVEAHLSQGRGAVTTLIVQAGTLKEGDIIIVGPYYGKVKAMFDDHECPIKEAGPSMPVEILGLSQVPEAGEVFYVVDDEKQAREVSIQRQQRIKDKRLSETQPTSLEHLYAQIQSGTIKELNVIVKADVQGSLEALKDSLSKIPSDKVKINFIHSGVGDVNASDVLLAVASKAIVIAFYVNIDNKAKDELAKEPVDVRQYRIIYDAVNDIKNALEGLLEAKKKKNALARVEIREVFKLSKQGIVAGCYVLKGRVKRKDNVDIVRNEEIVHSGTISSLKRFKDDVKEVTEGMECGITISGYDKIEAGDILETYEIETIAQKL